MVRLTGFEMIYVIDWHVLGDLKYEILSNS